jgi:hypothetical protein
MKKTTPLFVLLLAMGLTFGSFAQQPQANPKNIEIAQRFNYILDNGFEKIDLMKVGSIDKSFFNLGNAQLIIYDKNDKSKKNLLNSFTLMVEPSDPKLQNKIFQTPSPNFGSGCKQYITLLPTQSKITFTEVKLNTTLPVAVQQAPGSKHQLGVGVLPIAFFLYIK